MSCVICVSHDQNMYLKLLVKIYSKKTICVVSKLFLRTLPETIIFFYVDWISIGFTRWAQTPVISRATYRGP